MYEPDLIGMQEARYRQVAEINSHLQGYGWYGEASKGVQADREFVPIFYKKSVFEILDADTFWLSPTPNFLSRGWDAAHYRIATWVKLRHKESSQIITHYNTHFDHQGEQARIESAKLLLQYMQEHHPEEHIVLTGDFNSSNSFKPYQILNKSKRLTDAFISIGNEHKGPNWSFTGIDVNFTFLKLYLHLFYSNFMHRRIDYIFHSPNLQIANHEIIDYRYGNLRPSDHLPIIADISLPKVLT